MFRWIMPVGDLGPENVVTAQPDDSLQEVSSQLESENVGAIVVTEDDKPVGMVTDRDIALAVGDGDDVASQPVEDVMTEDPATIQADEEAMELSRTIDDAGVRRLPIVDDQGNLTGIVTLDDLVATIGEQLDNVADTIEAQSPDYQP